MSMLMFVLVLVFMLVLMFMLVLVLVLVLCIGKENNKTIEGSEMTSAVMRSSFV